MPIVNNAPYHLSSGFRDMVDRTNPKERFKEHIPSFLPQLFLYTQKGDEYPQIVNDVSAPAIYGEASFNQLSKYATHQTLLAQAMHKTKNYYMIHRLRAPGATYAYIALSLKLTKKQVPEYLRDGFGKYVLVDGEKQPTGRVIDAIELAWIEDVVTEEDFGDRKGAFGEVVSVGEGEDEHLVVDSDGNLIITDNALILPIRDIRVAGFGADANNVGLRLWSDTYGRPPVSVAGKDASTYPAVYQMEVVRRPTPTSQPVTVKTMDGVDRPYWSDMPGTSNLSGEVSLYTDDIILDQYGSTETMPKQSGPFDEVHTYQENIQHVLETLYNSEALYHNWEPTENPEYRINILTGLDSMGNEYSSFSMSKVEGINWNRHTTVFAKGGNDGDMSPENYDMQVREIFENYGYGKFDYLDIANWPVSSLVDTGFTMDTKRSMAIPMSRRRDLNIILSTQDYAQKPNTPDEDRSVAQSLEAYFKNYPESALMGTEVVRACIVPGTGKLIGRNDHRKHAPMTLALAELISNYMGADDGRWRANRGFDQEPYHLVESFIGRTVSSSTWVSHEQAQEDWGVGITRFIKSNRDVVQLAGARSIYKFEDSPMANLINMLGLCNVQRQIDIVFRRMLNGGKLSDSAFIERSNELLTEHTSGRYDERFKFIFDTYFKGKNEIGASMWAVRVEVYGDDNFRLMESFVDVHQSDTYYPTNPQ